MITENPACRVWFIKYHLCSLQQASAPMAPSVWDCAEMEEEVKAALQNDSVAQVQALEVKFNRALKEAAEVDYLHECAIPEEVGGFKRQIFGDAAHLGAQEVVKCSPTLLGCSQTLTRT